jgi:hypothetical protein
MIGRSTSSAIASSACSDKLARTTRIYAKYDPTKLSNVTRALTRIWMDISRQARAYDADHLLTTIGQGGRNFVVLRSK